METFNKAQVDSAVRQVMELIIDGWSYADIVKYVEENLNRKSTQAEEYMKRARERIREIAELEDRDLIGQTAATYDKIKRLAIKEYKAREARAKSKGEQYVTKPGAINALRVVLHTERAKARLFGIEKPKKIEITNFDLEEAASLFDQKNSENVSRET